MCRAVYRIDDGEIEVSGSSAKDVSAVLRAVKSQPHPKRKVRVLAVIVGAACVVLSALLVNLVTNSGWQGMIDRPTQSALLLIGALATGVLAAKLTQA